MERPRIELGKKDCKSNMSPISSTPHKNQPVINMKTLKKECKYCKKIFDAPVRDLKRGRAKFCSLSCAGKGRDKKNKPLNCQCAKCGKLFYRNHSQLKLSRSGLHFCTRKCKDTAQRIGGIKEIHPPHYGTSNGKSYRKIAFRELPNKCNRCSYDIHIAALVVHHKDYNRANNELDNLEILCSNCHAIEHWAK